MVSTRLAASSALSIRSKPMLDRNRGVKSKVVLIATSSFEQHGYKSFVADCSLAFTRHAGPEWASGRRRFSSVDWLFKSPAGALLEVGSRGFVCVRGIQQACFPG